MSWVSIGLGVLCLQISRYVEAVDQIIANLVVNGRIPILQVDLPSALSNRHIPDRPHPNVGYKPRAVIGVSVVRWGA